MKKPISLALTALSLALLQACGGGGGSDAGNALADGGTGAATTTNTGSVTAALNRGATARYQLTSVGSQSFGVLSTSVQDAAGALTTIDSNVLSGSTSVKEIAGDATYAMGRWAAGTVTTSSGATILTGTDNRAYHYIAINVPSAFPATGSLACSAGAFTSPTYTGGGVTGTTGTATGSATLIFGAGGATVGGSVNVTSAGSAGSVALSGSIATPTSSSTTVLGGSASVGGISTGSLLSAANTVKAIGDTGDSRMQALGAVNLAMQGQQAYDTATALANGGAGYKVSVNVSRNKSESQSTTQASEAVGSSIVGANNVTIVATGGGKASNILATGATITAGNTVNLVADNAIRLAASKNTWAQQGTNSSSGASVGVGFAGGSQNGFTIELGVSQGKGKQDGSDVSYNNTHVSGGKAVNVTSGGDLTLKGAVIDGKRVTADVGGTLAAARQEGNQNATSGKAPDASTFTATGANTSATGAVDAGNRVNPIVEVPSVVGGTPGVTGASASVANAGNGSGVTGSSAGHASPNGATSAAATQVGTSASAQVDNSSGASATGAGMTKTGASTSQSLVVRTTSPDTSIPTASLFRTLPGSTSHYLVETDPAFASYRNWLSSDYLLDALSYDPATVTKRLGDGFYEQRLIREQVAQLTGYRYLEGSSDDQDQYTALMNAGVTFARAYQLTPGIGLSAAQMAQLTSDIVWLVQQTVTLVDGSTQKVLVPQVYVRMKPGDVDGSGALLSADAVVIKISSPTPPSTNHRRPHRPTSPPIRPHIPIHLPRPVVVIPHRVFAPPRIAAPQRGPQILRTRSAAVVAPGITAVGIGIGIRIQTGTRPIGGFLFAPLARLTLRFGQIARSRVDDGQPAVGLRLQRRGLTAPHRWRRQRQHRGRSADRRAVRLHPLQLLGAPCVRWTHLVRVADLACRVGASDDLCIRSRAEADDRRGDRSEGEGGKKVRFAHETAIVAPSPGPSNVQRDPLRSPIHDPQCGPPAATEISVRSPGRLRRARRRAHAPDAARTTRASTHDCAGARTG